VGGYDPAAARRRVKSIGDTLSEIFNQADADGTTPLAAAMALARRRLASANGHGAAVI
jgi:hypothetical protein